MGGNNYKILLVTLIFSILFSFNVYAEEKSEIESVGEMKDVPVTPAPNWVIKKADEYLISLLGEDYFKQNLEFYKSSSSTSTEKGGWLMYSIDYKYLPAGLFINLRLDSNGDVLSTKKIPKKPYQFLINNKEAEIIARANGIIGNVETYIRYIPEDFNYKLDFSSGEPIKVQKEQKVDENYVWNVGTSVGTGEIHPYTPYYMLIDLDTGKILYIEYFDAAIGTVALGNISSGIYNDEKPKEICKINENKSINNYSFYCNGNFWQLQKQKIEGVSFLIRLFKFFKNLF